VSKKAKPGDRKRKREEGQGGGEARKIFTAGKRTHEEPRETGDGPKTKRRKHDKRETGTTGNLRLFDFQALLLLTVINFFSSQKL